MDGNDNNDWKPDCIRVDKWECPKDNGPSLLTMPNIPFPLHGEGCQPRTILGQTTWNYMRKFCYSEANDTCEVCGYCPEDKKRRHCLERGTEVLTKNGWKPIENITTNDVVATYNKDTEKIIWDNPTSVTSHFEKSIIRFKYKNNNSFSVGVSDGHRMLLKNGKTNKPFVVLAKDLDVKHWNKIPSSGYGDGDNHLSMDERLLIALQADGNVHKNKGGTYYCRIRVKKQRKIERLKWIASNVSFETREINVKEGYYGVSFILNFNGKVFDESFDISKMSFNKATEFIDELVKWDGWEGTRRGIHGRCYYSSNKRDIDFVQAVCSMANLGSHLSISERKCRDWSKTFDNRKPSVDCKISYNLEIKKNNSYGTKCMIKENEEYNDDVFCISVPNTFFVARTKNGHVFISANCHELFTYDYENQTAKFERCVCLCYRCHVLGIHTGRALTMYQKGSPMFSKESLLEGAENAFRIISEYNKAHPDDEPLRLYSTWIDYWKDKTLKQDMERLIKQYDVKFYKVSNKWFSKKRWGNWKVIVGNREYPTPYRDAKEWEKKMNKHDSNEPEIKDNCKGGVFDEIDKIIAETIDK